MSYKIKALKIDSQVLRNYSMVGDKTEYISPLGKLNVFVGTNNSGKSRFLRGILTTENLFYIPTDFDYPEIQKIAKEIKIQSEDIFSDSSITEIVPNNGGTPLRRNLEEINPSMGFSAESTLIVKLLQYFDNIKKLKENGTSQVTRKISGKDSAQLITELYDATFKTHPKFYETLSKFNFHINKFDRLYIPIIRGLRPAIGITDDTYQKRTVHDYFNDPTKHKDIKVFTGLNIYSAIKSRLLGSHRERQFVIKYENYLSEKFFEGKRITIIPRDGHDVPTIKIGHEMEKEIYHVGDGLQTLITITYPLFEHAELNKEKPLIACIEEPELLMHPSLQRTLMNELLCSPLYKDIQFFVTTHSNHFLDLTLDYSDISIFKLQKELKEDEGDEITPRFFIENMSNKDKQTLEILGVKNSSVFLSNATIWVEGITDRMYIRHAFNLWQQEENTKYKKKIFREDAHYSFVEYGGSNISHWDFIEEHDTPQMSLQSIVSHIFLIADNDKDIENEPRKYNKKDKKEARLQAIKNRFGANFYRLKQREIENIISPSILKETVRTLGAQKGFDTEINLKDYANSRMGEYIETTFGLQIANEYGAIRNKRIFAEIAIKKTTSVNDLSKEMIALCKKIQKFIEKTN